MERMRLSRKCGVWNKFEELHSPGSSYWKWKIRNESGCPLSKFTQNHLLFGWQIHKCWFIRSECSGQSWRNFLVIHFLFEKFFRWANSNSCKRNGAYRCHFIIERHNHWIPRPIRPNGENHNGAQNDWRQDGDDPPKSTMENLAMNVNDYGPYGNFSPIMLTWRDENHFI